MERIDRSAAAVSQNRPIVSDIVIDLKPEAARNKPTEASSNAESDLIPPRKKSYKITAEEKAIEKAKQLAKEERRRRKEERRAAKQRLKAAAPESRSAQQKVVGPNSPFRIAPQDLVEVVDFDQRDDPRHIAQKLQKHGGIAGLADLLGTSLEDGLPADEVKQDFSMRCSWFGKNEVPLPEPQPLWRMILENLQDRILQILLVGAAVNLVLGMVIDGPAKGWIEGAAIFFAVAIVVAVTSGNNWLKERKFRAIFLLQSEKRVKLRRAGASVQALSTAVQVGEVLELESGDQLPADGLYIDGTRFSVDESALTGETVPVRKSAEKPCVFAGTQVAEGRARVLVTTVGPLSSAGQIQALLNEQRKQETPLQEKLGVLANLVGYFGMTMAGLTLTLLLVRWMIITFTADQDFKWRLFEQVVEYFVLSITLVVVAVPEGLPLAVTISLAYSMQKMIKDKNFVRHLSASETMGEVTAICSDKTGTLTENRMSVTRSFVAGQEHTASNRDESIKQILAEGLTLNSTGSVEDLHGDTPKLVGNKTEGALLVFAYRALAVEYEAMRKSRQKLGEVPFSSARKRMSTLVKTAAGSRMHTKGAAEIVVELCTSHLTSRGVEPLSPPQLAEYRQLIARYAGDGLRTLTLAYREFPEGVVPDLEAPSTEQQLTLLAVVGIKDPVRQQVPAAVRACQAAGLKVRMVTGDNVLTAKHIARECGILTDGVVLEGPVFRAMSPAQMDDVLPRLQVLARSSPTDKFILVSRLKRLGEVVAVTGDGTNDAPALKEADVGVAMGIAGTDVAKNASDLVLLDDNFRSIVRAILWGRNVFDCIRKFLQFQLGVNVIAIFFTIIGAAVEGEPPLSPVQLLWVNLIMDTFGALALATDPPDLKVLTRAPHKRTEGIITPQMLLYMAGQFVYQMAVLLLILFGGHQIYGVRQRDRKEIHTFVFCAFILLQVFNMFHARILDGSLKLWHGVTRNPRFVFLLGVIVVVQIIMVTFAGAFLTTVPMSVVGWLITLGLTAPNLLWGLVVRLIIRRYDDNFERRQAILRALVKDAEEAHLKRRRTWAKMRTAVFILGSYSKRTNNSESPLLTNKEAPAAVAP